MKPPRLIDCSVPLAVSTPAWPGDQPFHCGWSCRREHGDSVNLAAVTTSLHVGTHADAPLHVEAAWAGAEALPAEAFVGDALVIALPADHPVEADIDLGLLQRLIAQRAEPRLLLRIGRTVADGLFPEDWPVLTVEAAAWLVDRGTLLWGVDAPSVDRRESKSLPVHHALLGSGCFILENLDLRAVPPGPYELLAQPLAVHGADAAPVRALLRAAPSSKFPV